MSRLGGAGAVAPLVTDIPLSTVEVCHNSNTSTGFLFSKYGLFNIVFNFAHRMNLVKGEETNQPGISGRMMAQNGR